MSCSVIIITYNSQLHLQKAMECLNLQTLPPQQIILVDTGSRDKDYLESYKSMPNVTILYAEAQTGFCKGNNLGFMHVSPTSRYLFLLNPDAFLEPDFIEKASNIMDLPESRNIGAITGISMGYDIVRDKPTGKYDTTGIFQTWYGHWYDRAYGVSLDSLTFSKPEELPAICGALFFCRKEALDDVLIRSRELLDSTFYMYKDDIDLSLRLRRKGWNLLFHPSLLAYHCRGWNPDRSKMERKMRLCSAKNELTLHWREGFFPGIVYSGIKYLSVKLFDF